MKNLLKILVIVCVLLGQSLAVAEDGYFTSHDKGWHWYEPIPQPKDEEQAMQNDPVQKMDTIRQQVKRSLDQAILDPSEENVRSYIAMQNDLANRSREFAKTWKEVLLNNPSLDFKIKHPTNSLARNIEIDEEKKSQNLAIKKLAKESGLYFFYRSTCPYCRAFAPIVKRFAEQNHMVIIPITTNGIDLPEFPNSLVDQGQSLTFDVKVEPALFVVNPYTHKAVPVGYGFMSETELQERMLEIAKKEEETVK